MPQLTTQQAFEQALQHHQTGRLHDAEPLYRLVLAQQPRHAAALHLLGVLAAQTGRPAAAVDLIGQAIAIEPNWAEAHNNLGNALKEAGQLDAAVAACRQAIALKPNYPAAYNNLGNALKDSRQMDQAIAAYRQAIALNPGYPEALFNLAVALHATGQLDAAIAAYQQAVARKPGVPEFHNNLGTALKARGQLDQAIAAYRQAIALRPHNPQAYNNLGHGLQDKGLLDEAITAYRQAIALRPDYAEAHNNLGNVLKAKGNVDEAIAAYRQTIALKPGYPETYSNLGNAFKDKGLLDEAVAAFRQALVLGPNYPGVCNNLGNALKDKGLLEEAMAAFRQAMVLKPDYAEVHSNLVYTLYYDARMDGAAIAAELGRWNQQHAAPLQKFIQPHTNQRHPERRLRIGYVSADFCTHASAYFLVPLLEHHNPQEVELFAYAHVPRPDAITQRLQPCVNHWRSTVGVTDEQLAGQIRQDQIDILVDLKVHTVHNRLLVFARKPAPVQVTWLGYPGSTGLTTIDYRLSDPYLDPPGMDESIYCEQTIRLPNTFWCYDPLAGRDIPLNALPATETGFITFACLNNFNKLNERILMLWAQVLRQVDKSRLLLMAPEGDHRQRTVDRLAQEGIEPGRVEFVPRQGRQGYLEQYHRIDLGLDSFPVNGHTTSLDSFWMGVPVVTLLGPTAMGRAGWCQLSNLGLAELAGQTPEHFVRIAVELAHDLPRLNELRATLRQRMESSPLLDAERFARNIEAAYRQMWRKYCSPNGADLPLQ